MYNKDNEIKINNYFEQNNFQEHYYLKDFQFFYLPPEYILFEKFTSNSALWSLGIIILNLIHLDISGDFFSENYSSKINNLGEN